MVETNKKKIKKGYSASFRYIKYTQPIKYMLYISILIMLSSFVLAQIETSEYKIIPEAIEKAVSPGGTSIEKLRIYNLKSQPVSIKLVIEGNFSGIAELDVKELAIDANSDREIPIYLYGEVESTGSKGSIKISGDIEEEVPLIVELFKKEEDNLGTIMMELQLLQDNVANGRKLNYIIDMYNLIADNRYNITLVHKIEHLANKTANLDNWNTSENVSMKNSISILREFKVPDNFDMGDYSLTVEARYNNYSSLVKGLFIIERPIYAKKVGGLMPVWSLVTILSFLVVAYFAFLFIKRIQEKKKRFHVKVDYKLLPQEGERSLFVGNIAETKHKCYFDMDRLTVHTIVAGSTGGGKSISAQDIVEECLIKGTAVAVFDPTAQWSGMLRKLEDKKFLSLYANFGLDPKKDAKAFPGNIKAIKDHREIVDIFKYLKPGEIQVFTTNTLDPKNYDTFVANMIRQIFHSKLDEFRGLKYIVAFDEIHRILPKFGGSGAGFLQIERGCREFRKWGIGILLISQVLSDFVGEIKANINTLVQMKTKDEGDLNRIKMEYGEEFIQSLVKSPVGSGMVSNSAWNRGQPFYVTFRPIYHSVVRLKDDELDEYNKYNSIVEQLEYEFDQLEELKQDVFDLRLELKLSKDKIKSGNFNMVKIYLDGLTPRVQKLWDKVGKKPKKLQIKLVSDEEMKEELEAAKKAKNKAKSEEKSQEAAAPKEEEEEEVKMDPEEVKENLKQIDKLFSDVDEAMANKDWFSINDRFIEMQSTPLPKDKKEEMNKKIEEYKKKIEDAKSGAKPTGQKPDAKQEGKEEAKPQGKESPAEKEGAKPAESSAESKG